MNNCILLSIKPQYVAKILNCEKTIEIRKYDIPIGTKVYIYCTKTKPYYEFDAIDGKSIIKGENKWNNTINGKVVASFVVSKCENLRMRDDRNDIPSSNVYNNIQNYIKGSCISTEELCKYLKLDNNKQTKTFYAIHISQLKIFDRPKELSEFYKPCNNICFDYKTGKYCKYNNGAYCQPELKKITKAPQKYVYVEEIE